MENANSNDDLLFEMLKVDVGKRVPSDAEAKFLKMLISSAKDKCRRHGMTYDPNNAGDQSIIVSYAAWLYRKRAEDDNKMPPMLKDALHDRIIEEKGRVDL